MQKINPYLKQQGRPQGCARTIHGWNRNHVIVYGTGAPLRSPLLLEIRVNFLHPTTYLPLSLPSYDYLLDRLSAHTTPGQAPVRWCAVPFDGAERAFEVPHPHKLSD